APDYETIMKMGLDGIISRINRLAKGLDVTDPQTPGKRAFYAAALTSIESLQNFILRYADLAESKQNEDYPEEWKLELVRIAEACRWISSEPPRDFREAIQLSWFVFLAVALEASSHHHCFGPGHIDRYLLPFYLKEEKTDLADALLEQLFLKCNEFTGPMMSAVIVGISGRNPDGSDATNELSHKCLEISDRARMYFPGLDIHWHRDIDEDFMKKACRLLRNGMGQPSFFNIDLIIKGLERYGIPYEHAVDHLPSTCTETSIQGRTNPWVAWTYENIPMCLLLAMFGGRHPISGEMIGAETSVPESYDGLREVFLEQIEFTAHASIEKGNRDQMLESLYRPFPLLSCFIQDCLERGIDISHGGAMYNLLQPEAVGVSNAVDGLAAIKTLLEANRYSLEDFRRAIVEDFEGHEEIRRAILEDCPKHGNNIPWVNDLFAEVSGKWCSSIEGHTNFYGGPVIPGFLGWTVWIGFGNQTPATPDGRKAGMPLANCIGPCTGVALKGTPSMLMSTCGLDHSRGLGGIVFNVRFSPGSIAHEPGIERLKALIETAMELGIFQMQINMIGSDLLREAQKNPESHADLLVRIGGYLVPFTQLPKDAQRDVIARTEMEI
ncbi:MAG: hypothetical protein HXS50_03370, partial [Theionarchaea archaeon]|nr:hypothetical protein [Theionarchaea archaeon]